MILIDKEKANNKILNFIKIIRNHIWLFNLKSIVKSIMISLIDYYKK